jgi:hypothetical protein
MPMVMYTEEELIEALNKGEKDGAARGSKDLMRAMAENTMLRRKFNEARDAITAIVESPTIKSVCGWYPEIERARLVLRNPSETES